MPENEWLTASTKHEGLPLALRVRPAAGESSAEQKYPHLSVIFHKLAEVRNDGMPEPDYNDSLAAFDHDVHAVLEDNNDGMVMIVETFSGKRNYYARVGSEEDSENWLAELKKRYPEHELTGTFRPDAATGFYEKYREKFKW